LSQENLLRRIELELGSSQCLDQFYYLKEYEQFHKFESLGVLVHISAGNVFLGCIDSLLMGFLTKNINVLKLSSQNHVFPQLFAQSLQQADRDRVLCDKYAICYWKGGQQDVEDRVKKNADAIICWGGEESVKNWKANLPTQTKVFD